MKRFLSNNKLYHFIALIIKLLNILLLSFCFCSTSIYSQEIKTRISVYEDIFFTESGLLPLPENAVELKLVFSLKSEHFQSPLRLAIDPAGNLYVVNTQHNLIQKFSSSGEFLAELGTQKNSKPFLRAPDNIYLSGNVLGIYNTARYTLELMDPRGMLLRSQKFSETEGISDFAIDNNSRLYVAHYVQDRKSPLITVYEGQEKKFTFGQPIFYLHSPQELNSVSLSLNEKGELYVSFVYFPIVRKYSPRGELLAEYKVETPVLSAKETYNLKLIGEGVKNTTVRAGYKPIIIRNKYLNGRLYLLTDYPRLEILELSQDGQLLSDYWAEFDEVYEVNDMAVAEINGEKIFYVAHSQPPHYDIDVFKKK